MGSPMDPAVLKTLRDSELLHRSVFTTPPYLLCYEPFFEMRDASKQGKMMSAQAGRDSKSLCDSEFAIAKYF